MNDKDYSFDEVSSWMICLMRLSTNSKLSVYAPYDMATLLDLVSMEPSGKATAKAFDAIALWAENNFPQWEIKNIVPDYKVEQ